MPPLRPPPTVGGEASRRRALTEDEPLPTLTRVTAAVVIALQVVALATAALAGASGDAPSWVLWILGIGGVTIWAAPFLLKDLIVHVRGARARGRAVSLSAWGALGLFALETALLAWVAVTAIHSVIRAGH